MSKIIGFKLWVRSANAIAGPRVFMETPMRLYSSTRTPLKVQPEDNTVKNIEEEIDDDELVAPDLENLENRWLNLKQEDQYEIIDHLKDQQELSWRTDLKSDEKKAAYYLAYGDWGPRASSQLNVPEFIFRLMSSSLLFVVLGFSLMNHLNDKEELNKLQEKEENSK